jgi:hypothetical protein
MESKKLFYIEFGEAQQSLQMSLFAPPSQIQPLYVVATGYDEAAEKALAYVEYKQFHEPQNILDDDGSLISPSSTKQKIRIKTIKIASDEVVW